MIFIILKIVSKKNIQKYKNILSHCSSSFWLSDEEKNTFKEYCVIYFRIKQKDKELQNEYDANGYKRNNDGQISTRSNLGKEYWDFREKTDNVAEEAYNNISILSVKPQENWKYYNKIRKELINSIKANKIALGACFTYLILMAIYFTISIAGNSEIFKNYESNILFLNYLIPIIIYFGGKRIYSVDEKELLSIPPKPPEVTTENVDRFF